jgi:DNA-binding NarL/FixJ family response regulator
MIEQYLTNSIGETSEEDKDLKQITIVLAEDQPALRQKLRLMLDSEPDFKVVGDVNNGLDAIDLVRNIHPDVLVFDSHASNNQEIIKFINLHHPETAVIVPYKIENKKRVSNFTGVYLKLFSATELVKTIRSEKTGKNNSGASVTGISTHNPRNRVEYRHDPIESLTTREREVFNLVVQKLTNYQIAAKLAISRRTVEIHRARVLRKLGLHKQYQQLVDSANELGILSK